MQSLEPENKHVRDMDLEDIITMYGNDVLRMAYLYVKDRDTAEDIFQDVFVKVSLKISEFEGKSSLKTWILRITINTCKDYLKSAWKRKVDISDEQKESQYIECGYDEVEKKEERANIYRAVLELPVKYREVIICVFYKELSMLETANILEISEGTVKSRLSRAKAKMKKLLEGGI